MSAEHLDTTDVLTICQRNISIHLMD